MSVHLAVFVQCGVCVCVGECAYGSICAMWCVCVSVHMAVFVQCVVWCVTCE